MDQSQQQQNDILKKVSLDKNSFDFTMPDAEGPQDMQSSKDQKFPCPECDKVFKWKKALRPHWRKARAMFTLRKAFQISI